MESGLNVIFMFIFGLLPLLLLFWIYNNAEENGHGGCLWVILVLIFGYAALAVYLIFFSGLISNRQHRAPDRNEDLQYRSMYRTEPASAATQYSNVYGAASPMMSAPETDLDFSDEQLDKLIRNGKTKEARAHLNDMISIAKEMGNRQQAANYKKYESKVKRMTNSGRAETGSWKDYK